MTQSWYLDKGAHKYDRLSRRPWPQVAILEDSMDFQMRIGRQPIESRTRRLGSYLRSHAAEIPGVVLYTANDPDYPADPHGIDGVRISTNYYNTFDQVGRVLQGLRELASGMA